ncbi:helix-turn-helix transcriptional regulator [Streptomyces hoynatensis]|uniref:helix-turn-helix transcriptional regulator n=1 Tax=Streptomyces hoynatensis TaxID=1141874 RepID=UPI00131A174A|nr:helix-turn-helix transcriptional regulator [Streptomyces hoynatensis]
MTPTPRPAAGRDFPGQDAPGRDAAPDEAPRRQELAAFLRARRARLAPEQVGLPARRRRRTPGLRREDVAERAGISTAWYTYLEQGRAVRPSPEVLARLADALCLTDPDRAYLRVLAGHAPPPHGAPGGPGARLLQSLVDRLAAPAYVTDAATRVLAWNPPAREVFGDYAAWPPEERCLLRLLFTQPAFATALVDRDAYAARVVHTFRQRSDAHLTDPAVMALVGELARCSAEFRRLWESRELRRADTDTLLVDHPGGRLTFTMLMFQDLGATGIRFSAYLPADAHTERAMAAAGRAARPARGT